MTTPADDEMTGSLGVGSFLRIGPSSSGTVLSASGSSLLVNGVATGSAAAGTTFPATPNDGQSFFYTADATNGIIWHFRYRAASASTFKWEYVGGSPLFNAVNNAGVPGTTETTASGTYVALATAGPSLTCPLNGDYQVDIGFLGNDATNAAAMSYDIGGTGASDNDAMWSGFSAAYGSYYGSRIKTNIATATALVAKYRTAAGTTADFRNRWMRVTPVRTLGS